MKNNSILIIFVVAILVGAGAFFGGMKYQQSKRQNFARQFGQGQEVRADKTQGNRQGFRPVNGEIISSDDKSITVKMQDGGSKIVLLSDKTEISKASSGVKEDLKTGEKVMVVGTENSDGSVTAQNIQLNPIQRGFPGDLRPTGTTQ